MDHLTAPSSSSSSFNPQWNYDVFLSFRGEDTRNNFISHLYNALKEKGIITFIDDELRRGDEISPALVKAIEESRISIIVFSKNYASSTWCLNELVKILECKEAKRQMVRPVFYNVDPSDVRNQKRTFGEAFSEHEDKFGNMERVYKWKAALKTAANLSGWHLRDGHESKFIQRIVEEISSKLNRTLLNVARYPVKIDTSAKVSLFLSIGSNDVRILGIHGIGGIGKTTIAKAIYNLIADQFEGSSFLANVREITNRHDGLIQLQETLLYEILGDKNLKVRNAARGINVIRNRLCHKRVLLVLDDVDKLVQLQNLAGEKDWFGLGSRIIITTRDAHLLVAHGVDRVYKVKELDDENALKLFCWNAFGNPYPTKDHKELSHSAVNYAKGLPLALVVLGSFLKGRSMPEWKDALNRLNKFPNKEINEILKISFDGLEDLEKAIFLDIACFFKGRSKHDMIKFWEACDFHPDIGIQVLIEKSLVSIEDNMLQMHDLIQAMGRKVVHDECPNDPSRRSRLWFHEDVLYVLRENMGTNAIEGIMLNLSIPKEIHLSSKVFKKMKKLRLLMVYNARISGGLDYLPNELKLIYWYGYPSSSLPTNFFPNKLVALDLSFSKIEQLGEGSKVFENLKHLNFSGCDFLTQIPDFSTIPNLESLVLQGSGIVEVHNSIGFKVFENLKNLDFSQCAFLTQIPDFSTIPNLENLNLEESGIVEVHNSVGFLDKLVSLNLSYCYHLRTLPISLKLKSLQSLTLASCIRLEKFPDILETMPHLSQLFLENTAIKELPSSIEYLIELRELDLRNCTNLMNLPSSIYKLQWLVYFNLDGCSKLRKFPELSFETTLFQERTRKIESMLGSDFLPEWLLDSRLRLMLPSWHLGNCALLELDSLITPHCFLTLRHLDLSGHNFVSLPACITRLTSLVCLSLDNCVYLQEIGKLPPKLTSLNASGCRSLERYEQLSGISKSPYLRDIELSNCHKLIESEGNNLATKLFFERLHDDQDTAFDITLPGSEIPAWLRHHSTEGSISFEMLSEFQGNYAGLAFCTAVGPKGTCECEVVISINGHKSKSSKRHFEKLESDHVWLSYIPRKNLWRFNELVLECGCSQFEVSFKCYESPLKSLGPLNRETLKALKAVTLKSCGYSLVCDLY